MSQWITDALLAVGGWDTQHPGDIPSWEQNGYDHNDVNRVLALVKCGAMFPKAYSSVAREIERKAAACEERGLTGAACLLYGRAMQLYGRAQYSYYCDDPRKRLFHADKLRCFHKVSQYSSYRLERVELPFGESKIYCNLYTNGSGQKQPCLIILPGMDQVKEEYHGTIQRYAMAKGLAVLAVDSPGQGESLANGLKCSLETPEETCKTVLDYLEARDEIDSGKIVLFGGSLGSYWGTIWTAADSRIKAAATAMAAYGRKDFMFKSANPKFRANYKYMSGVYDDARFDEMAEQMHALDIAPKIEAPFLMIQGEFDELNPVETTIAMMNTMKAPRELWVLEQEFHPMGGQYGEMFAGAMDWLSNALDGKYRPGYQKGVYWKINGEFVEGNGSPDWWRHNEWK
ncbi:MAG: alpha/beta fold hydrolase [Oscillospiraceae bacterium]|jgi:pimeloyl-ACP methyl ester carboxylesterase|nr:alpha/beta fold hydrolase [Oscillospiraceae bacterium]